jgi:glycerol-3-phosphate dehydrogenase
MVAVSQGIHLVLPKKFLPGRAALMVPKTADGRVLFAVPWHDRVVVGTTDTPQADAALEPRALAEEQDFVLEHARRYLAPDPAATDVLSVFTGQRPLVKAGNAASTAALARDHTIVVSDTGLVTITGGKWTTYRQMAADVVDRAEKVAGLAARRSSTEARAIHGAAAGARATTSGGDAPTPASFACYGSDAPEIAALVRTDPALAQPLHPALPYVAAEVVWHARMEMARTVEDVLARRTRALLLDAGAAGECAACVAGILARELGRDAAWAEAGAAAFRALARGYAWR